MTVRISDEDAVPAAWQVSDERGDGQVVAMPVTDGLTLRWVDQVHPGAPARSVGLPSLIVLWTRSSWRRTGNAKAAN
jgi:hypothetical protein